MSALARDVRGNTLALMAAALIPMMALAGSAVDIARLYVVKVRLQQACDAGALAGRKAMTDPSVATLDPASTKQADDFFNNNFKKGWMNTSLVSFTPVKTADNQVAGTASATVPMTIMQMFGSAPATLNVTCQARFDIGDSDIMFVLDTTGSMACVTKDGTGGCSQPVATYTRPDGTTGYYTVEKSGSKLSALRTAVVDFATTVAASAKSSHIRYGFVTYTSTVNVGFLLPTSDLVQSWKYQSRRTADVNNGSSTTATSTDTSSATCNASAGRTPASGYTSNGTASVVTVVSWSAANNGTCKLKTQPVKMTWTYAQQTFDVSKYVTGATVTDPSKITGATSKWQGCIEERDTTASSTFNISALPHDLDPDLAPDPTDDSTKWRPMWPDVIYYRGNVTTANFFGNSAAAFGDYAPRSTDQATTPFTNMSPTPSPFWDQNMQAGYVSCGKPAQRLREMTPSEVSDYVNAVDFKAQGGTYHDTGMIWGTRLISPTGIFAQDTSAWQGDPPPKRYIVFMTDGDMSPNTDIYGLYGMENYDKRVTGGNFSSDTAFHNARFLAECAAAKARNIRIFVVGFGQTLTSQLSTCASPNSAYFASDNDALTAAFTDIAGQVAMLRISQ